MCQSKTRHQPPHSVKAKADNAKTNHSESISLEIGRSCLCNTSLSAPASQGAFVRPVWGHAFKACRYIRKNGTAFAGRANRLGSSEARSAGFKCTDRTQRIRATKPPAPTIRVSRPQGVRILICRKDIKRIQQ